MDFIFFVRSEKRSMEHVVNLPCFGETQLVGDQGQDLDNCEGSFIFWGEFWVSNGAFEVSGFQPDFVSFGKRSESLIVMQGHDLASEFMSGKGFISGGDEGL